MTAAELIHFLKNYFIDQGMTAPWATYLNIIIVLLLLGSVLFLFDWLIKKGIVQMFRFFADKTVTSFDDFLVASNFPKFVAHFLPLLVTRFVVIELFTDLPEVLRHILTIIDVYAILLGALVCRSIFRTTKNFLLTKDPFKDKPLDSYIQVLMIFVWVVALLFIVYRITGYSVPSLATFGAASALLLLIFKDTILGFIASIQITVNDIVRIGDWITFSKYGADGFVTQISLATVKVRNFDNTITTIPTYSLISDSFQNWRGMQESAGRRIKRSIHIKQNSVSFLTKEQIEAFKNIERITDYVGSQQEKIDGFNKDKGVDKSLALNGRNQTNLGVFRKYVKEYLENHSAILQDEFLMVRHLEPTSQGIPIQIYCFSADKKWENYEHIQADIFDHIIAAVSYFGLEIYEYPSGKDLGGRS
ncbi:MAG: mechanosensitive ion channel domain-containing protein [Gilvibacter sp.]